jgi:two-component system response regulator AtoC
VPPQAVLLDLRMPGLVGFVLLGRCRSEGGSAPVIALSAMDEKDAVVKAMRLGASDYLVKPVDTRNATKGGTFRRDKIRTA